MLIAFLQRFLVLALLPALGLAADFDREMILIPSPGTTVEDSEIRSSQRRVQENGARLSDFERLGWAFVAKARRTLDVGYYKLAEKTADTMDAAFGPSEDAALLRGVVFHNLHRFADAEGIGRRLVAQRGSPPDLALLSDALMEEGKLSESIEILQRMANMKPGTEVDTRVAHIRWLKGDLAGAIGAMEQAVRETSPRDDEAIAWMLSRLSSYWLQAGRLERAKLVAAAALRHVPDYAPALLAEGRILLADGKAEAAASRLERAAQLNPLPEYFWTLAEAWRAANQPAKAAAVEIMLRAKGTVTDPRTLALFLATRGEDSDMALRLARAELVNRADVLTHDAVAWALFAKGDITAATAESRMALAEATKDPRSILHAAVIANARGDYVEGRRLATECEAFSAALLPSERALLVKQRAFAVAASRRPVGGSSQPILAP